MIQTEQKHQFLLIIQDPQGIKRVKLEENIYSLGRANSCQIVINEKFISRYHATLIKQRTKSIEATNYLLTDGDLNGNKSQNGLRINGILKSHHYLSNGDSISIQNPHNLSLEVTIKYLKLPSQIKINTLNLPKKPLNYTSRLRARISSCKSTEIFNY